MSTSIIAGGLQIAPYLEILIVTLQQMSNNNNSKRPNKGPVRSKKRQAKNLANARRLGGDVGLHPGGLRNLVQSAPLAMSRIRVNPPRARNGMSSNGNRTIVFEEYVQDIITSPTTLAFRADVYPLQPGLSTLFAWLAEQAINYQEYRFRRVTFRFETDQQASIAGKVMYAFSPDAADPTPVNKQEMLEYGIKGKSAVWQEFDMPVPMVEALGSRRYIRSGTLAANLDIKTYDMGVLFVATSGIVATSANIGELYVQYEVELITPVVQSLVAAQARSITIQALTGISETVLYGSTPTTTGGLAVVPSTTDATLTFNRVGNYLVVATITGTGLFTSYVPTFTVSGCTATAVSGVSNAAANAGTVAVVYFTVTVSNRGATCLVDVTASSTTVTANVMRISVFA